MKYQRFEDLPVWQVASGLAVRVYSLGEKPPLRRHRSLRDQIERAALSVSNNIAEGFERGTTKRATRVLVHCARVGGRSPFHALCDGIDGHAF